MVVQAAAQTQSRLEPRNEGVRTSRLPGRDLHEQRKAARPKTALIPTRAEVLESFDSPKPLGQPGWHNRLRGLSAQEKAAIASELMSHLLGMGKNVSFAQRFAEAKEVPKLHSSGRGRPRIAQKQIVHDIEHPDGQFKLRFRLEVTPAGRLALTAQLLKDDGRTAFEPSLHFKFEKDGQLLSVEQHSDAFNAWGQFLLHLDIAPKLRSHLKEPEAETRKYYQLRKTREVKLEAVMPDHNAIIESIRYVPVQGGIAADTDIPLGTFNLWKCTALVCKNSEQHYMNHVNGEDMKGLKQDLRRFITPDTEFHIVVGTSGEETPAAVASILSDTFEVPADRITIYSPRRANIDGTTESVVAAKDGQGNWRLARAGTTGVDTKILKRLHELLRESIKKSQKEF